DPGDHPEQCRLAAARRSEEADEGMSRYLEAHGIEGVNLGISFLIRENLADAAHRDGRITHRMDLRIGRKTRLTNASRTTERRACAHSCPSSPSSSSVLRISDEVDCERTRSVLAESCGRRRNQTAWTRLHTGDSPGDLPALYALPAARAQGGGQRPQGPGLRTRRAPPARCVRADEGAREGADRRLLSWRRLCRRRAQPPPRPHLRQCPDFFRAAWIHRGQCDLPAG